MSCKLITSITKIPSHSLINQRHAILGANHYLKLICSREVIFIKVIFHFEEDYLSERKGESAVKGDDLRHEHEDKNDDGLQGLIFSESSQEKLEEKRMCLFLLSP